MGINYPSEKDDWKKFDENDLAIALDILYVKQEKINPAYVSKQNSKYEEKVVLLMIQSGRRWNYLAARIYLED